MGGEEWSRVNRIQEERFRRTVSLGSEEVQR